MKTDKIWKYHLTPDNEQHVEMPEGARILDIQVQENRPVVWALVDTDAPKELVRFYMIGTGEEICEDTSKLCYVGTFQVAHFVFHVFTSVRMRVIRTQGVLASEVSEGLHLATA